MWDESSLVKDVSDTACWVAALRAQETKRPDALFKDPLAESLAGERGEAMIRKMSNSGSTGWAIAIRTRVIDEMILDAIQSKKIDTVLNLAAGLDSRPYRLQLHPELRWIEVDLPGMVSYKEKRLVGKAPNCRLERVPLDLSHSEERSRWFEKFDHESKNVLVLTEGLLPYLDNETVESLAKDLFRQSSFQWWIQDFYSAKALRLAYRKWEKKLSEIHAPFKFSPEGGAEYFERFGWKIAEFRPFMEESQRLKREWVIHKIGRLMLGMYPKMIRERILKEFRLAAGFLLLGR